MSYTHGTASVVQIPYAVQRVPFIRKQEQILSETLRTDLILLALPLVSKGN